MLLQFLKNQFEYIWSYFKPVSNSNYRRDRLFMKELAKLCKDVTDPIKGTLSAGHTIGEMNSKDINSSVVNYSSAINDLVPLLKNKNNGTDVALAIGKITGLLDTLLDELKKEILKNE